MALEVTNPQTPRTSFSVTREKRGSVFSQNGDRSTPSTHLYLEFDWDDAERARHLLRNVVAEAEARLETIIAKVGRG